MRGTLLCHTSDVATVTCSLQQVGVSSRNNPASNFILGSIFAREIGSNFIIRVRSTYRPQFIWLVDLTSKHYGKCQKQKISGKIWKYLWKIRCRSEHIMWLQKHMQVLTEINVNHKKTVCWLWIFVRNMGKYVFGSWFTPFHVQYTVCFQQLMCKMMVKSLT